jgi:hypothetical protein
MVSGGRLRLPEDKIARRLGVERPVVSRLLAGKRTVPNLGINSDGAAYAGSSSSSDFGSK